jgi:crotonobetainyl-CoA:carnitine CoA-transferase CaiB-like acyl-CoA transferase
MMSQTLKHLRVLDLGQLAAGPLISTFLADLGADVIKVEPPEGDPVRSFPPHINGESLAHLGLNRTKRICNLDLKNSDHAARLSAMALEADVLVESFRPGVMDRLGFGYEALSKRNPKLIYCSVSAYGAHSPRAKVPGVDGMIQAVSGLMSITGSAGSEPSKIQAPIVDMTTGQLGTMAVLAALLERNQSGKGRYLNVSLFGAALQLGLWPLQASANTGAVPLRCGSGAPYATPNEAYPANDGWLMVAAYQPARWTALCQALGKPTLAVDPRFATLADRLNNRPALFGELAKIFKEESVTSWITKLEKVDVMCAPIHDYGSLLKDASLEAYSYLTEAEHPKGGRLTLMRPFFDMVTGEVAQGKVPFADCSDNPPSWLPRTNAIP